MNLPEVSVLSLGGTISSSTDAGGAFVVPTLAGETLVSDVPELAEVADVSAFSFRQAASGELTVDDLIELAGEVTRRIDGGADGVVVTQGTDTIEETAFVLDLLVDREAPVVVTGAMRNPTLAGADGPANLLAAVRVAAGETARGLGAVVVFNDEIHAARFVRKTHTQSLATFRSDPVGPVGWVSEGKARVVLRPSERRRVVLPERTQNHRVALLTATLGDDGRLIPMVKRLGYAGLVVEAFGGGHVPSLLVEPLETLANTMPVVLASRAGKGEVLTSTYGFSGSETDLLGRGLIAAGPLDGLKSRLLLLLLLNSGATKEEIAERFDRWLGG
ncbi:MAG: L-asparaginase [uncultured Rubrobacteraceae bacterium]|uniref:L-asparaginase n=1 Tax=uncultured Rubrobacteraceae bacterium TaxID=349277 RepID=A0A6J4QVU1_9ACTN|nr:MAG: L-asparaginase [uncultured Rubrobacteraceae bacterium]